MPHSLFRKSFASLLVAALVAVNVAQVETIAAKSVYALGEAESGGGGFFGSLGNLIGGNFQGGKGAVSDSGFFGKKVADARDLVAIFVDKPLWDEPGDFALQDRVKRYAEDIQKALPKTQAIILPVSREPQTALKIQQVTERLYLEGNPKSDVATQLKGIVIIGEVPLPVVRKDGQAFVSLLPYTDFLEPTYVFSPESQTFERNPGLSDGKPEIWHGVIRPPLSGLDGYGQLAEYFDKNHLYHTGDKAYTEFQKKVLVSDLHQESKNLNKTLFPRYQLFLKNLEDLAYNRYSAKWLAILQKAFDPEVDNGASGNAGGQSGQGAGGAGGSGTGAAPANAGVMPDIQTVHPIRSYHVQYPKLFGTLFSNIAAWAKGSGRWATEDMDSIPQLIARKDLTMMEYFRTMNDEIEKRIDEKVEQIQKPFALARNVVVDGRQLVRSGLQQGFDSSASYTEYPVGSLFSTENYGAAGKSVEKGDGSAELFINGSIFEGAVSMYSNVMKRYHSLLSGEESGRSLHYLNGINFSDLVRTQQCVPSGGSQQKTQGGSGTAAVSQMVMFMRSLNLMTLNVAGAQVGTGAGGAAGGAVGFIDPRMLPSLLVHTRPLSSAEASKLTNNAFAYGARIEPDIELGIPAIKGQAYEMNGLKSGDIILSVNGKKLTPSFPLESALRGLKVYTKAEVTYWRAGLAQPKTFQATLFDANADPRVAGCYAVEFQKALSGQPTKCFPEAATNPVADRAGTLRIADTALVSDPDGLAACTNISSYDQFKWRMEGGIDTKGTLNYGIKGLKDLLAQYRTFPNSPLLPPENSKDPTKMVLIGATIDAGSNSVTAEFTLQDFFNQYGVLNSKDDTGNYADTNGNGKVDQIAWIDFNKNGKLDLWATESAAGGDLNIYKHPAENEVNASDKIPKYLDVVEFKKVFPQYFKGDQYIGSYTGEFVGGDWGVDEPDEILFPYVPSGTSEIERWKQIEKDFFLVEEPRIFSSPRRIPTRKEYRTHIEKMIAKGADIKLTNVLYGIDACVETGGAKCPDVNAELAEVEILKKKHASIWLKFTPNVAKKLSTAAYHKEPTAATLRAQNQAPLAMAMPIDKIRYVSFRDASGVMQKIEYPNIFSAGSYEQFLAELAELEEKLGATGGVLTSALNDSTKLRSMIEWRGLSLEAKHQRILMEYLNAGIESYSGDSPMGYEAMYFVADGVNGSGTSFSTDFSGEVAFVDSDEEYSVVSSGGVMVGTTAPNGAAGAGTGGAAPGGTVGKTSPEKEEIFGKQFLDEPVDILKWFDALGDWWKETKNSFQPLGLDVSEPSTGNTFNATVQDGPLTKGLVLTLEKTTLNTFGDSTEIVITAKDASGKLAKNDHKTVAWVTVEGAAAGDVRKARVIPELETLREVGFKGRAQRGLFLSQGVAKYQIVSGTQPQKLVIRAYAYNEQGEVKSESMTLSVTSDIAQGKPLITAGAPTSLSIKSDTGDVLLPGGETATTLSAVVRDAAGVDVLDRLITYQVFVTGPAEIIDLEDSDTKMPGHQVERFTEPLFFTLRSKQSSGSVSVNIMAKLDDGTNFEATKVLMVRNDLGLTLSANAPTLPADGGSQAIITAQVRDASGTVVNYDGPVTFSLNDERFAKFASEPPKMFVNGKAIIAVRSGTVSGLLSVRADTPGLSAASTSVNVVPLSPYRVSVAGGEKKMAIKIGGNAITPVSSGIGTGVASSGTSTEVTLVIQDMYGNATTSSGLPVTARITKETQKYGFLKGSNGSPTNQVSALSVAGAAKFIVESRSESGPIHLVFSAPGLVSATYDITTSGKTGSDLVAKFQPSVLYASILGGAYGNTLEENYLAGTLLFSGRMQAAASLTAAPRPRARIFTASAYGGVEVHDPSASVKVLPSGGGEPLAASLTTDFGKMSAGTLFIKQQGPVTLLPNSSRDFSEVMERSGIFVKMASGETNGTVQPTTGSDTAGTGATFVALREKNIEIAKINTSGGIEIFDPRLTLQLDASSKKLMRVNILLSGLPVASVQIGFSAVNSLALLSAKPTSFSSLPLGVWLHTQLNNGAYTFERSFSTYSSRDALGFALTAEASETLSNSASLGSPFTSLEDSLIAPGVGFAGDNKHMLLLAARNTVGESHLPYASEIGIILGDPTVRLPGDNLASSTGFTRDLGRSIATDIESAHIILPVDVNSDGKKDLLVGQRSGSVRYLAYTGGEQRYSDRGILLDVANGIITGTSGDINNDGKEDLLIAVAKSCTKSDTCLDLYRNQEGLFVRENLKVELGKTGAGAETVSSLSLVDMNLDGWRDLVLATASGQVRLFMNAQGTFQKSGQLIGSFSLPSGASLALGIGTSLSGAKHLPGGSDLFPDILALPRGAKNSATAPKLTYFLSSASSVKNGAISFTKTEILSQSSDQKAAAEKLDQELKKSTAPDEFSDDFKKHLKQLGADSGSTAAPNDGMNLYMDQKNKDEDGDGMPDMDDLVPNSASADGTIDAVGQTVEELRCAEGCLPLPSSNALLVPGKSNDGGSPGSWSGGTPIFGASFSCATYYMFWPPCDYKNPQMTFRIYVSPTTTAQVGFAICAGAPYPKNENDPGAQCFAFAPNISLIPASLCKALSEKMSMVMDKASGLGSGDGLMGFVVGNGVSDGPSLTGVGTSGANQASALLAPYEAEKVTTSNVRISGFPAKLTKWMDDQIEEVLDKLADLPDLYIMYPNLSSIASAVVPKVPSGKLSGYTKFLAYLNSIPLISIEPKPLTLRVPALSRGQALKFSSDYQLWFEEFDLEIGRLKGILKCSGSNKPVNPGAGELCQSLDINGKKTLDKIQKLLKTLDQFQELPKKILEYKTIEQKYIRQLINYLKTVSTFMGGYVKRQEMRIGHWLDAAKKIKNMLATWQGIIDVTAEYSASCDNCKSERGSLFEWYTKIFAKAIPTEIPVIPFPKWPDIVLDFSQVEAGVRVSWPDITFAPQQILLPSLPRVKFPIEAGLSGINFSSPNLTASEKIKTQSLRLDLDAFFEDLIPDLPEIPEFPDLPNLPNLPPLPVFKLPDVPPAPKIQDLDFATKEFSKKTGIKIDIKKSLDTLKKALKIVCLLKKGYLPVAENNLRTQIEELTQRPLLPPLSVDLEMKVPEIEIPKIEYESVDQYIVRGAFKFELQTDIIYNFFKELADYANGMVTDLVNTANTRSKNATEKMQDAVDQEAGKKTSMRDGGGLGGAREYRLVAEKTFLDPATIPEVVMDAGDRDDASSYLAVLRYGLEEYLKDNQKWGRERELDLLPPGASKSYAKAYTQNWISEFNTHHLSRYLVQQGVSDTSLPAASSPKLLAYTEGNAGTPAAGAPKGVSESYSQYGQATSTPLGIYIENPQSGAAEKLIDFTGEMSRQVIYAGFDADGDSDSDSVYSLGGDIYFKENRQKISSDAFTKFVTSSVEIFSLDELLPLLPAVRDTSAEYSQRDSVTISWTEVVPPLSGGFGEGAKGIAGYDVVFRDAKGLTRKRYLYAESAGAIPYDAAVTVEELDRDETPDRSVTLSLDYGTTYFQILPLTKKAMHGTSSPVFFAAPQLCGDSSAPLVSAGPAERYVPVTKTLKIDASSSFDAKSDIAQFSIDMNAVVDSDQDGDAGNDRDLVQPGTNPHFVIGPFDKVEQRAIRVWSENAKGYRSSQSIIVHVFVPTITLSGASLSSGSAHGFVTPPEPQMPFALVRERGGNATVLGDYITDDQGKFLVNGLAGEGKMVIKNAKGEIVAEYDPATGKMRGVVPPYSVVADALNPQHLALVRLKDGSGAVLASFFQVPDGNTDAQIDPSDFSYTAATVGGLHGVHLRDSVPGDTLVFRSIAANDPAFFGGVEIIDTTTGKRIAVVDSTGHVYFLHPQAGLDLRDVPAMPYFFALTWKGSVIGELFIASPLNRPLQILDGKQFEPANVTFTPATKPLPSETPSTQVFTDVPTSSPISGAINLLESYDIVDGYLENGQKLFKPDQLITRAEFTKIVLKSLCIEPSPPAYQAPSPFTDVAFGTPLSWFYPFVKESYIRSLIAGYLGEKGLTGRAPYKPFAFITRAESVKIVLEALRMLGIADLSSLKVADGVAWYVPFVKAGQNLTPYLKKSTGGASSKYVVTGEESLTPNHQMTRGDFAVMAARVLSFSNCHSPVVPVKKPVPPAPTLKPVDGAKTTMLPPGIYTYTPECVTCPCIATFDNTGKLLPGDRIFAIISPKDRSIIHAKSNVIILSP